MEEGEFFCGNLRDREFTQGPLSENAKYLFKRVSSTNARHVLQDTLNSSTMQGRYARLNLIRSILHKILKIPLLILSQNVVLFCQKGTTDKKPTSHAVLKAHFWITKKGTTVLDSPILSFFAELLDRVGLY